MMTKLLMLLFLAFPYVVKAQVIGYLEEATVTHPLYPEPNASRAPSLGRDAIFSYEITTQDSTVARAAVLMALSAKQELIVPDYIAYKKEDGTDYDGTERDDCGYPFVSKWVVDSIISLGAYNLSIPDEVYDNVVSLKLPETIKGIRQIHNMVSLQSFHLPSSVKAIPEIAFLTGCPSITSLSVEEGNTVYDSRDNCNAIIKTATNTLVKGCSTTRIPASVEVIGNEAFSGCSMAAIDIPDGVKAIGINAFMDCENLSHIEIPSSVSKIEAGTFWRCERLSEVSLPESIDSIFRRVFTDCPNLKEFVLPKGVKFVDIEAFAGCCMKITCLAATPPEMTEWDYFQTESNANLPYKFNNRNVLIVPAGCKDVYQNAPGWRTFGAIFEMGEEIPTGIEALEELDSQPSILYDLSGRPAAENPTSAIYIQNGKKMMMK